MSPRYHELNGNHSSGIPGMRNLPLFIFLTGLVFFFYVFYIYQAQGTELSLAKEQLELTGRQLRSIKEELIDTKADLEKTKASETELKTAKEELTKTADECQTSLRTVRLQSDSLTSDKAKLDEDAKDKEKRIRELADSVVELKRNNSAMQSLAETQSALVVQLNQTLQMVNTELASLKATARLNPGQDANAGNAVAPVGVNGVNLGDIVNKNTQPNPAETLTNNAGAPLAEKPASEVTEKKAEEKEEKKEKEKEVKPEIPEQQLQPAEEEGAALQAPKKESGGEMGKEQAEKEAQEQEEREMVQEEVRKPQVQGGEYEDNKDDERK